MTQPSGPSSPESLDRLIRAAADLLDAHTAALFLAAPGQAPVLELRAFHSLSDLIIADACLEEGQGLIGWVFREQRPLHVTRFDNDSATLGIYSQDAGIKAMLAVPLPERAGVLVLDSRNKYQFPDKAMAMARELAGVIHETLKASKVHRRLGLYRELCRWEHDCLAAEKDQALGRLMEILDMDLFIRVQGSGPRHYRLTEVLDRGGLTVPGPMQRFKGRISRESGLAGWILRHERDIILDRFGRQRFVSYLVEPDDGLGSGSVVLGLYLSERGPGPGGADQTAESGNVVGIRGPQAVILRGEPDISWWPEEMPRLIRHLVMLMDWFHC